MTVLHTYVAMYIITYVELLPQFNFVKFSHSMIAVLYVGIMWQMDFLKVAKMQLFTFTC